MSQSLAYRPEIDGLRAVAVMAVLLFHLDPAWLPGGFAGVDVFLVISGFLITSIIVRQQTAGHFRPADFYLHRIRRIAPVYFVVTAATLLAGCLLMLPLDLQELARSAGWSTLSLPNVYFWRHLDTGYFAADSRQQPLLHLWSLGVEEQFYLLWPLVLILCLRRVPAAWLPWLLLLPVAASFAHAQHQTRLSPSWAYYMLPARAGELGIGCLLALWPAVREGRRVGHRLLAEMLAVCGLILILCSLFLLGRGQSFPGWNALPACLGAALVIIADSHHRCSVLALLRSRPLVWIGLVSYSLYLWHWPVLAFLRYLSVPLDTLRLFAVAAGLLILAGLSHRWIETPARRLHWPPLRQVWLLWALPCLILLAAAWLIQRHPERVARTLPVNAIEAEQARLQSQTAPAYEFPDNCQQSTFDPAILSRPACVHGLPEGAPADILLWGDSHAAHYIGVLGSIARHNHLRIRNASLSTCPPVFSTRTDYGTGTYQDGCTQFRALIEKSLAPYRTVVIGASWTAYRRHPHFETDFQRTLDQLEAAGKQVVLLAEVPRQPAYDRQCAIRQLHLQQVDCRAVATVPERPSDDGLHDLLAQRPHLSVLDVRQQLCQEGVCSAWLDDQPVYFDTGHLSLPGSWQIGARLLSTKQPLPAPLQAEARSLH